MKSLARSFWPWWVALSVINLVAYGYAIRTPFMLDDVVHLRWLNEHEWSTILTSAAGLSYYRPLPFLLWKALWLIQGQYHGPTLHAINLLTHLLNTGLVMVLLVLLRPPTQTRWVPFAAATLFALFPFSYQAVPWVGSFSHLLVLSFMLSALILAWVARGTPAVSIARWAGLGSLVCTFLAPFAHDVGLMTGPLLVWLTVIGQSNGSLASRLKVVVRMAWPHALVALGAFAWVTLVRINTLGPTNITPSVETLYQNGGYFLQGLIYPVAPLARLLMWTGFDDMQSVYIIGGLALAIWFLLLRRTGQRKTVLLALGWAGLCLLPAWILLKFSYIIDGPRLLYQAAVGISLLWVAPLDALIAHVSLSRLQRATFVALPILALAGSVWFLQDKAAMYAQATRQVDQLLAITPPQTQGPTLLVNYPRWLAPRQSWFALGHEGVSIVPEYAGMFDFYWTNSGREIPIEDVEVTDVKRPWRFNYALVGTLRSDEDLQARIRNNVRTVFTDLSTPNLIVYDAGHLEAQHVPQALDYIATYDRRLALITGTVHQDTNALQVSLVWQSWQTLPQEVNTFVHVQTPSGELVAQTDGFPIANLARPSFWQPGDQWRDIRLVPLPPNLAPGEYLIRVGVYPVAGGNRLVALSAQQTRYENDSALVTQIRIP